ncbi:chalcone isomerase family protein [Ideonella azotifigens]|uniref:Chalcone isomerase domain-containing protein n=1 Tax=Ideonella azotifigens TaxID=513160 RepID=A0ABN1JLF5_9BURK|nr:chalcone isomerase family protein [Ideonella azotifigens]MCD2339732.1 chalcone isomerase family protein [Ideonella azotifigens]
MVQRLRRHLLAALLTLPLWAQAATPASPPPAEVREALGEAARAQGLGRMRFLGIAIYEIALWAATPVSASDWTGKPLALEIRYAHGLDGAKIAERSLDEMQRQGGFSAAQGTAWLARMKELFPDVKPGDRITGVLEPSQAARFYVNGRAVGELRDAAFANRFFGIWLSEATSEPTLRQQLLGRAP